MASNPATSIFIGSGPGGAHPQQLELKRANRHGLIAGATGTGKTVTLQGIVEGLSDAGVPTFVADVKGDLAGLAMASLVGRQIGNFLLRGILGSLTGKGVRHGLVSEEKLRVRTPKDKPVEVRDRRVGGRERAESEHGPEGETA